MLDIVALDRNHGLLELGDDHLTPDISLDLPQYHDPIIDSICLTKFTITDALIEANNIFLASEERILICDLGLDIINNSQAKIIILQATSNNYLNILGKVNLYNNQAELILISPNKIYCNDCSFNNFKKVTFCTLPNLANLANFANFKNHDYCNNHSFNEREYLSANLDVKGAIEKGHHEVKDGLYHYNKYGYDEVRMLTREHGFYVGSKGLIANGLTLEVFAGIVEIKGRLAADTLILVTISDIDFSAKVEAKELIIESSGVLHNHAHAEFTKVLIKARKIDIYPGSSFWSKEDMTINIDNNLMILSQARLKVGGDLVIENAKLLQVKSGYIEVGGDALLKVKHLYIQRDDQFKVGSKEISITRDNAGHGWACSLRIPCNDEYFQEAHIAKSQFIINGNLIFEGNLFNIYQSYLQVNGNLIFKENTQVNNVGLSWKRCILPAWENIYVCAGMNAVQNHPTHYYDSVGSVIFVGGRLHGTPYGISNVETVSSEIANILMIRNRINLPEIEVTIESIKNIPYATLLLGGINVAMKGEFISTGITYIHDSAYIKANNIGVAGLFTVKNGNAVLIADKIIANIAAKIRVDNGALLLHGENIYGLIVIENDDGVNRNIYKINGDSYFVSEKDTVEEASIFYVAGDFHRKTGGDLLQSAKLQEKITKNEYGKKYHLIERQVDEYEMMLVVNGKIDLDVGGDYHGAGVKMLANENIKIKAGEKLTLETTSKEYVKQEYDKVKNTLLGKSSVSLKWISNKLANVEIEAPNGEIYISSKECVFEGVSINGKKPVIHCDKLEIKEKTYLDVITKITKKSGFLAPSIPLYDLVSGKEEVNIPVINSAKELFDMKSLTDLAPIMKLIAEVGAFKAKFDILKAQGISTEASMIGALLSQYATATLRFGKEYIKNSVEYINVKPSIIIGDYVFIKGQDGLISGSEVRAHNDLEIEFDNLDIKSAIKQVIENLENKRVSFDIGIDLFSGVTLAATNFAAKGVRTEVNHQAAKLIAEKINIKLDNKFTIIGGQINAREVSIEALNIEIYQVVDQFSNKFSSHSESIGVTFTAAGGVLPHVALNYANKEEESGYMSYISGIVADKIKIIANSLTASNNAIVATDSLVKYLVNYHEIEGQQAYHHDTNLEIGIKTQAGTELKIQPTILFAAGDGENKISGYFSPTLIDGVKYIFNSVGELLGGSENKGVGETANDNEQELPQAIFRELVSKYGKDTVHAALKNGKQLDGLLNNPGNSYKEEGSKLIITLPQKGLINAGGIAGSGLIISLDIITKEEAILLGIHALKVGKFFVRLVPVAGALLLAYEVGSYLSDQPELTAGKFLEATEFAKDIVDQAKDVVKTKPHETGAQSASGGPEDDGDEDWQDDKELSSEQKIQSVIDETQNTNSHSFTSRYILTEDEAMEAGIKWLGDGYKEIGKPGSGVYRSDDGLRQFRIDRNSLSGNHNPYEPHVHLETINLFTGKADIINHIIIRK